MGPALLAINTGPMGPNNLISLACASSNHSFCSATNHIRSGDADIMVESGMEVGLFKILDTFYRSYLIELLSYYQVMKSLEHVLKRGVAIVAEYLGGAVTYDAHHHMIDLHLMDLEFHLALVRDW
ncbi:hypothetical protein CQW23_08515 [Capsicum baccatum]|uniref:beta-ketoacyl-[acyl-carrier-protein] synthase I n=1 Tax=Capsicum baccatum TaxID=33114 RepID=A0A2G2X999_CAPBA|nr:hypothetical protein CQW23_08515 [Capsicum baccatum]